MLNRLTTKQSNSDLSHLKNIECDITEQLFSSNEELFIANVLLRHYLFHRATDEILNYLFSEISEFQIEEDAPIFYEGDEGTCMFMIKKGQVELTQKDTNQKFILTDGEVFGEAGLIREGNRRTYTARSISYLEFYIIDINAYKEVAEKLMKPNKYVFDLFEYFDEPYKDNINLLCAENELKKGTTVTDLNGVFAIEYKELYDLPNLTKLVREICPSENSVTIKEYFEGATSFVDRIVSYEKPKIRDGVVDFGDVKILFDKDIATIKESTDYHTVTIDDNGEPEDTKIVYYTDLILKKGLNQFSFTIDCK
jgi:hypothetical protein